MASQGSDAQGAQVGDLRFFGRTLRVYEGSGVWRDLWTCPVDLAAAQEQMLLRVMCAPPEPEGRSP